jgi:N-carbamoyl-L-amino-acid hydrolase
MSETTMTAPLPIPGQVKINPARLMANMDRLASITEPERPWTRIAFSPLHRQAREWLREMMQAVELSTRIDSGGNLVGTRPGRLTKLLPLATGSHSGTVPAGGRFDGASGLIAGLEVVATLQDASIEMNHTLGLIDFLAEEPNQYGVSCVGSRALTGALSHQQLGRYAPDGTTLTEGIRLMGGDPDKLDTPLHNAGSYAGFVELHIEQGKVLETAGDDIGVVSGIVGITRLALVLSGRQDHAGATPMGLRRDALVGASLLVAAFETMALQQAETGSALVATVGRLDVEPNAFNVVPGRVSFVLEIRSSDDTELKHFLAKAIERAERLAKTRDLVVECAVLSANPAVILDEKIKSAIVRAAAVESLACRLMPSGAGHDAAYMARLGPTGMIFIPCFEGRPGRRAARAWARVDRDLQTGRGDSYVTNPSLRRGGLT